MSTLLKVEDLHLSFQGREVVHGVSFEIKAGEKLAPLKRIRVWQNCHRFKPVGTGQRRLGAWQSSL